MNRKQSYAILGVAKGASLNDVKKAYRKRAFELHPDLSQAPDASKSFQELNEAYVLMLDFLEEDASLQAKAKKTKPKATGKENKAEDSTSEKPSAPRQAEEKPSTPSQAADRAKCADPGQQQQKSEPTAKTNKRPNFLFTPESTTVGTDGKKTKQPKARPPYSFFSTNSGKENVNLSKEEVLSNVLRDPFARRVFEDIYREIRQSKKVTKNALQQSGQNLMEVLPLRTGLNIVNSVKDWLKRQIDDEQTVTVPVSTLRPGMRIRLQIQQGMSGKLQNIEVTLPLDYTPGRPIRLRGLGRKVGPWLGDLYLRIIPKST